MQLPNPSLTVFISRDDAKDARVCHAFVTPLTVLRSLFIGLVRASLSKIQHCILHSVPFIVFGSKFCATIFAGEGQMWRITILLTIFQLLIVLGSCQVDLDGDGQKERVVFRAKVDGAISVFCRGRKIWQGVPKRWQAWKLVIADVDGDGKKEFLVGVNIKTRYFPQRHKSVFVLGWNGKFAYARWLGSHLSKPLVDFAAASLDEHQGDELVTLEVTRDGCHCLVIYRWIGFGFTVIWQSQPFARARLLSQGSQVGIKLTNGQRLLIVNADGKWALKPYRQSVK